MLTAAMLTQIMPRLSVPKAEAFLPHLIGGMAEFEINTELRVSAYLAQLAQESTQLTRWEENLNYTAKRLVQVWPNRFPTLAAATPYAKNPKKLAIRVYGSRMGNRAGTEDGWDFRGRMPMQATGREMYQTLSEILGIDLVSDPDLCMDPAIAFRASAAIFAVVKKCNGLADGLIANPNNLTLITKRINGGTHGLEERKAFFDKARKVLPNDLKIEGEGVVSQTLLAEVLEGSVPDIPDSAAELSSDSQPTKDPAGSNSVELSETAAGGDPLPAAGSDGNNPSLFLNVEDWKPFVTRWLKWAWGGATGVSIPGGGALGLAALNDPDRWHIYAAIGGVAALLIIGFLVIVTASLLIFFLWNRKEIVHYITESWKSKVDPKLETFALKFEKK